MKKIIAIIALVFVISSCGNTKNKANNTNEATKKTTTQEVVDNETEEIVSLSPDEEEIIEELLK